MDGSRRIVWGATVPDRFIETDHGEVLEKREGIDEVENLRGRNGVEDQTEGFDGG